MQKALDVLLAHVRGLSGKGGLDADAARTLSGQIRALRTPLSQLLAQRRKTLEPALPAGEAIFAAAAEARVVCSACLQSIGR